MSVHWDHAAARKAVHALPPGAIGPQLPQHLSEISDEGEVIASTREPAQKPAVPRQPAAQQQAPAQQQQQQEPAQQQQQHDPWTAVWSTLLG